MIRKSILLVNFFPELNVFKKIKKINYCLWLHLNKMENSYKKQEKRANQQKKINLYKKNEKKSQKQKKKTVQMQPAALNLTVQQKKIN